MRYGASPIAEWAEAWAPPPKLTVSEWADANRVLPETSAARGARWRSEDVPHLPGIMNVVHEPGVRTVALMKCHQSGGSEALNNVLGYHMEHDPCPMLLVHPTAAAAQAFSKERLADMIRSTPALRASVQTRRIYGEDRRPESTLDLTMFPGGFLALGGANTPNTFARWSVRLAMADDCDRFPAVVGEEGDPAQLLANRTTTFHDRIVFFVSTPTLMGGRISALWERSDKRRFHARCPRCGRVDYITWNDEEHFRVVFADRDPATARIECPGESKCGCGWMIFEPQRMAFLKSLPEDERWKPTAEPQEAGLAGFHVPGMLSPWVTLQEMVEKFLLARAGGRETFKVWVNTYLGEGWDDRTSHMEASDLEVRVEDYGTLADGTPIEVPAPAAALTAGVDVQASGFLMSVYGWGPMMERWLVDYRTVPGDPRKGETQGALLEALSRKYQHASGLQLPIHATCIDTGWATEEIYEFVRRYQVRRIYAIKGDDKGDEQLIWHVAPPMHGQTTASKTRSAAARAKRLIRPVALYGVNTDAGKAQVMASLALAGDGGPYFTHFPAGLDLDHEFFAQLCSHHREKRVNRRGEAVASVWIQDREADHALDQAVYALAAFRILRPNLADMAARIRAAVKPAEPAAPPPAEVLVENLKAATQAVSGRPAPPAPAPTPARATSRRVWRSSYLGR
ncbi:MAG: phage terminase large subunit family protein [Candidatus Methylomirabilales bacterium]